MLYSCTHMATVSVRGLTMNSDSVTRQHAVVSRPFCFLLLCYITKFLFLLSTVLLHNVEGWFYEKRVFIGINRCIFRRKKQLCILQYMCDYIWFLFGLFSVLMDWFFGSQACQVTGIERRYPHFDPFTCSESIFTCQTMKVTSIGYFSYQYYWNSHQPDLRLKIHKHQFWMGHRPTPNVGTLDVSPRPPNRLGRGCP